MEPKQIPFTYARSLLDRAVTRAELAMHKFPQPNYVLTKVAEEAGEVVKTGVHLAEGRDFTHEDLENEVIDVMAMCLRLLIEGDELVGLSPTEPVTRQSPVGPNPYYS